jgi:hypothetical protein
LGHVTAHGPHPDRAQQRLPGVPGTNLRGHDVKVISSCEGARSALSFHSIDSIQQRIETQRGTRIARSLHQSSRYNLAQNNMQSLLRHSRPATRQPRLSLPALVTAPSRHAFHSTPAARKDREKLQPARSGTDGGVASSHGDAAFNPDKTSPEAAKQAAGANNKGGGNPLEVSGANQEMSKPQGDKAEGESRAGEGKGEGRASRGVRPEKNG